MDVVLTLEDHVQSYQSAERTQINYYCLTRCRKRIFFARTKIVWTLCGLLNYELIVIKVYIERNY